MASALSGLLGCLVPLVLALALLNAGGGQPQPFCVRAFAWTILSVSAVLLVNSLYGFWAFHLACRRAPPRKQPSSPPRVSFDWSAPHDFPEDFGPLLALKQLIANGDGVTGALVDRLRLAAELELRPGDHVLRVAHGAALALHVAEGKGARRCRLAVEAKRDAPDLEAIASKLCLELPYVRLSGVAGLLDGIWELWTSDKAQSTAATARHLAVLALRLLEAVLPIHLSDVEATAVGDAFLLFFSGSIGPFPFTRIHLPPFVVPRLKAPLSGLLSPQPLVGHRFRPGAGAPVAHPALVAAWTATLDVAGAPPGVDGVLQLRDGSCPTFAVTLKDDCPLHVQCEVSGKLDGEELRIDLRSFSITGDGVSRGLRGSAEATLSVTKEALSSSLPGGLPEALFRAQCQGSLTTPLVAHVSLLLDRGSELPDALQLTFGEEHPLMLGRANIVLLVNHAALHGRCGFHADLPMLRKRDLLQLPEMDLHFDAAVSLEEESSFVDDGFSTAWFQDVAATAKGRLWSEHAERLRGEAAVKGSGRVAAEVRDSPIVQALVEAEGAALRFGPASQRHARTPRGEHGGGSRSPQQSPRSPSARRRAAGGGGGAAAAAPRGGEEGEFRPEDSTEVATESRLSVRVGDVIHCGASCKADGTARVEILSGSAENSRLHPHGRSMSLVSEREVDQPTPSMMLVSFAGSVANVELGEVRAQVGDLSLSVPPTAGVQIDLNEALIDAEGIGRTHLHASWSGLGQPLVQHTSKKIDALLPPPPSGGGVTVEIGDMGQMSVSYDSKIDMVALGNRLLDEESTHAPFLQLAAMLNLQHVLEKLLNFARVVRNVLRSEGIEEPKDVIPAERLARFMARILLEIGTDGKYKADDFQSSLERALLQLVRDAVDAKGLDVTKVTRMLWDFLPPEACNFVKHYTAEVDFAIKWVDSVLRPTEASQGPDPSMMEEPRPSWKYRRELQEVAPCASRLYEVAGLPLPRDLEEKLYKCAPYLTAKQLAYMLRCSEMDAALRTRLLFLLRLKNRVEKVAGGYGGPAFMPQGMAVGFFLATAIRGSFASKGTSSVPVVEEKGVVVGASRSGGIPGRLADIVREQQVVSAELKRLQDYQQQLVNEASELVGLGSSQGLGPAVPQVGPRPGRTRLQPLKHQASGPHAVQEVPGDISCILDCLAPHDTCPEAAKAAVRANAAAAAVQHEQASERRRATVGGRGDMLGRAPPTATFDLGCSLLGPMEVAVLLQSGLAAVPQGRQVQQNQRMLLELLVSQPPLFQRGVLYELSNNGSTRVLSNHLLALLDLKQDAVRPQSRLDVADLLTTALGVQLPRRADFMAGGSHASNSYILFVHRAAKQVLEECAPYVALKYWVQQAEVTLPSLRGELMPSVERALREATQAIEDADAAGQAWLERRSPVWAEWEAVLDSSTEVSPSTPTRRGGALDSKKSVRALYEIAFARCAAALKAHHECFDMPWFKSFWARNYDALTVVSVLRNAQQDVDEVRRWVDAQLRHSTKSASYQGVSEACDALWSTDPRAEACLLDCLIEILFFYAADREKYRGDPLLQLVIDEPPGHFNFTVVSAMGVITEGAAGREMSATYARLQELRGVTAVRADTATLQSVDYNAREIERAVREQVRTPWGWVGYSQGCANAFRAESLMLQGTPEQQKTIEAFRCRQLLFSAANGSAHATCGAWKLLRALIDGERFFKRFQASMSASTQELALNLLQNLLSSRVASAFFGSVQSLTHEGARRMWRDAQHCHRVPTSSIIGVIEDHTLPESLQMLSKVLVLQMDYSKHQDTQVAEEEAVAHPTGVKNANAEMLKKVDMKSAVQRTHHWSVLKEEVSFLQTKKDEQLAVFEAPKDRHIFPWLEVNARFGVIERLPVG